MFERFLKKRTPPQDRAARGKWGENLCLKFLRKKGLKILTKNFSCKTGEIDLIMAEPDGTIVFVEVKTRANENFANAEAAVTARKKNKMKKTARFFLAANDIKDRPLRFDIVTIVLNETADKQIRHYENAFS